MRGGDLSFAGLLIFAWAGCGGGGSSPLATGAPDGGIGDTGAARIPWPLTQLGAPEDPIDNPSTPSKADLGRLLFHDPVLSADKKTACVTCHSQYWGMGDGLVRAIGVGGSGPSGLGREGPTQTRRNAPTLWNAAYRTALFWDGRAASLEEQALFPISDPLELGSDAQVVASDVAGNSTYAAMFAEAFPGESAPASLTNLTRALAAFVRTVVTTDAPYDRFARGDENALSALEVRGMFAFASVGCADCHRPPLFADDRYYAVAKDAAAREAPDDLGRFEVTFAPADRAAFRVPSLRNVRETGPYFHDGHARVLRDAVVEMVPDARRGDVTDDDIDALTDFIGKGLMDKAHLPDRPFSVPSGFPIPTDGFTVPR